MNPTTPESTSISIGGDAPFETQLIQEDSAAPPQQQQPSTSTAINMTGTNSESSSILQKTSQASANLRDRIARLIKDIVVHHDDIQYVQLADQASANSNVAAASSSTSTAANNPNLSSSRSSSSLSSNSDEATTSKVAPTKNNESKS
jgi:hypothetical protein